MSDFKIGTTQMGMTALDALTTALPDPQWEFAEYRAMARLGSGALKGMGPQTVMWEFPLLEDAQVAQLESFQSAVTVFIQTRKRSGVFSIFEAVMNWQDPRQDGDHIKGLVGYRGGLTLEFLVIQEVGD